MGFGKILGKVMPVVAMVAAAGLAACDGVNIEIEGDGVPLAELDMTGDAPTEVALAAPDTVVITAGDEFTIDVEGSDEARDRMRFALEDGTLAIHRENGSDWSDADKATINIMMPAPGALIMAGSGTMSTDAMGARAEITSAGSGTLTASGIAAERFEVTIAGSGTVTASGTTDDLELTVAGSGSADLSDMQVGDAEVTVAGSGDAAFASDGRVEASIVGSGTVRVSGSAQCTVESVGSGDLICEEVAEEVTEEA